MDPKLLCLLVPCTFLTCYAFLSPANIPFEIYLMFIAITYLLLDIVIMCGILFSYLDITTLKQENNILLCAGILYVGMNAPFLPFIVSFGISNVRSGIIYTIALLITLIASLLSLLIIGICYILLICVSFLVLYEKIKYNRSWRDILAKLCFEEPNEMMICDI
jgi:hypothetical protein